MSILFLSSGVFNNRFGQQKYEWQFIYSCIQEKLANFFRIILLNDNKLYRTDGNTNNRARFIFCGNKIRLISKIKFVLNAFWYIRKDKPRIIVCGHINLAFVCLIISRIFKIKYILLTHGTDVWNLRNKLKLKALASAYKIITVSRYTAAKIQRQVMLPAAKIIILPNSVDTLQFVLREKPPSLIKKYDLSGHKILLTVARLDQADREKGYDRVIAALPSVKAIIHKVKYFLIGEGNDLPRIKKLINDLQLNSDIVLTGFVPDEELVFYYNLCDCFIMPSKQEGFGIVFLEALACGKPVIAGNGDGSRDALLDGRVGTMVSADNVREIADAIIGVLQGKIPEYLLDSNYLRSEIIKNFDLRGFSAKVKRIFENYLNSFF